MTQKKGYSYKPFDERKCIFVYIPKSAGVSIGKALFNNLAGAHLHIAKYQFVFSKNEFDNYFKFSFVRNPWDRIFSAYNFLTGGGMNETDKRWSESNLSDFTDFNDFVRSWVTCKNINVMV